MAEKIPGSLSKQSRSTVLHIALCHCTPDSTKFNITSFVRENLYIGGGVAILEEPTKLATLIHFQCSGGQRNDLWSKNMLMSQQEGLEYFDVAVVTDRLHCKTHNPHHCRLKCVGVFFWYLLIYYSVQSLFNLIISTYAQGRSQ